MAWGLGRVGWGKNVDVTCNLKWCYARATSWLGVWVGWGGAITLMTHVACNLKWCYARATSWLGVWFGWGGAKTLMLLAISSDATLGLRHGLGLGWVGWGNNVHVTCNLKWCRTTTWLGVWFGWGGAIMLMLLAISSDATLGLRHGLGFGSGGVGR